MSPPARRLRRTIALLAVGAAVFVGCGGLIKAPPTAAQQKALAQHYTNNDPIWTVLSAAVVTENRAKGELVAAFPPQVAALDGQVVTVSGFMTPLEPEPRLRHFILTRRSVTCPFCPPNGPSEAVEVRLASAAPVTSEEVTVSGRLRLTAASSAGLFYTLPDARPARRTGGG